ncbi:MAG: ATP-dependent DNA helicase RecQ [Gemmatimonadota bacterium]
MDRSDGTGRIGSRFDGEGRRIARDPDAILRTRFGYPGFRPGQRELVDAVLAGRDALGVLPTGGGKSVCYQIPALLLPGLTIVVSPLVSLMVDQLRRAIEVGLRAEALHAGLPFDERRRIESELEGGRVRVLLLAPERLASGRFARLIPRLGASLLAVDEAHCISMWGHDFRPAYRTIGALRESLRVPVLALTATATPRVREDIEASLRMRNPVRILGSFDRPNLLWSVRKVGESMVSRGRGNGVLIREAVATMPGARLVYASTRGRVESLRAGLARHGIRAEAYHAGLPPDERDRVQRYFLRHPRPLVVATNAFGMGIDRSDVRIVVHDQLPGSLEDYYQESGRAGRDGLPALCLALHTAGDARVHRSFLDRAHPPLRRIQAFRGLGSVDEWRERVERRRVGKRKLLGVARYARTRGCRRRELLSWFGECVKDRVCGSCDRCMPLQELVARIPTNGSGLA